MGADTDKISKPQIMTAKIIQGKYILLVIFILFFTILSVNRHYALKSYLHDLGNIDQVIWNTLHGNFFQTTSNLWQTGSYLGDHFSPILLVFVPFYALGLKIDFLLFFQSLAIGLSGLPIYEVARRKLKSNLYGLLFLILYFSYPVVHNALLYDFHQIALGAFFLSFAFYFLVLKKEKLFLFFSLLAIFCQEEIALLVFTLSTYAFLKNRFRKTSLFLMVSSVIWFIIITSFLIPYFNNNEESALSRYHWLGDDTFSILKNIVFHPLKVLEFLAFKGKFGEYIFGLFFPLAFLPLLSPLILIVIPIIGANLLSSNLMMADISFYHSVAIVPFIFFAAIYALERIKKKIYITLMMICFAIISVLFFSVTPFSLRYTFRDYLPSQNALEIEDIKGLIPQESSLSVQHNLGPHFSERREIYVFPKKTHKAEYVLVDLFDPYAENPRQIFKFPYALQISVKDWIKEIEKMFEDQNYGVVYWGDGYYLFKKGAKQNLNKDAFKDFQFRKNIFVSSTSIAD